MRLFGHESEYRGDSVVQSFAGYPITVCGAGAVGSNLIDNLARQGFTSLKAIDFDRVEPGNIGTQRYGLKDVGKMKVDALNAILFRDLKVSISQIDKKLQENNCRKFLTGSSLLVDCFDNHEARLTLQQFARSTRMPCLHVGLGTDGYAEVAWDVKYVVPPDHPNEALGPCDAPLARNLIMLAVVVASESIVDFAMSGVERSYRISLSSRSIKEIT